MRSLLFVIILLVSGCASVPTNTVVPWGSQSSETLPHEISCFIRNGFKANGKFCQPKMFDI